MLWLATLLIVLLLFALIAPFKQTFDAIRADTEERAALLNDEEYREYMRQRRYAPLHTLPALRWHSNFDTLDDNASCFSVPTLVTVLNDTHYDCSAVCNDERAVYFFVDDTDKFIVNGVRLARGGYCTTNAVPRNCNKDTSLIMHSVNQWTCIAEDPRVFAGVGNVIQIAGKQHSRDILASDLDKIVLWDNLLNRRVNPLVNSMRRTWDDKMEDGRWRFEVRCDARDSRFNQMFVNPYNRLECLPNVCTFVNHVHNSVKPNFRTGECDCGDVNQSRVQHVVEDDPRSKCAAIVDRLDTVTNAYNFRVDCLSLDTPVSEFAENKLLCPPEIFNINTDFAYTFSLRGVIPRSGNGIHEPTARLWRDTQTRVRWNDRI